MNNTTGISGRRESNRRRRKLSAIFRVVFAILTLSLVAWTATVIILAHQPDHYGYAFWEYICLVEYTMGYVFLGQMIVMAMLTAWLFIETHKGDADGVRKQLRIFATISFFFGLSYIGRFVTNEYSL